MATIHGCVRLDKIAGTNTGSKLIAFQAPSDFDNGQVFMAEDLVSGEREQFTVIQPATANISAKSVYLAASVETTYLAGQTITDFFTPNTTAGRGVLLSQGDIVTITNNVISGVTVVGQYVASQNASYQLVASATLPTTKFIGKVIGTDTIYGQAASVIEVIAN